MARDQGVTLNKKPNTSEKFNNEGDYELSKK